MLTLEKPKASVTPIKKINPVFQVKDLNIYYGDTLAVKDVSVQFPERAITALIGPSGCGKSTFLRTFNRMNDLIPEARATGEVIYQEWNILDPRLDVVALRKEIGMLFQKPNPFPKSIYENVVHGLKCAGVKKKAVLDEAVEISLKQADLWDETRDRLTKSALSLSGGQQQRLCLARALALKPKVLLLDEPTSALDPISTAKIEELLLELMKEMTIIIVTHNMQQAARIADYTAFFFQGRLEEYGATAALFEAPKVERTKQYLSGQFG
ncbi:phosphate ABC transporter ATP-binding protein PstB [Tuberibacillus calidus]|uniref:phosphate ABC transporter ATP-binding protein PstB n=1 Tax=Tuberibacillus calidus TaxID=340097 RepID=UPI0003FA129F|nr:phosphate ABC transporter ATP-binding protein PstB [Tuberibacillus calidus]